MARFKKTDIETRYECGCEYPVINVKCYSFGGDLTAEKLNCSEETFQKAMEYAWDSACEQFWEEIQDMVQSLFCDEPKCGIVKVFQAGRSGGWLVVNEGLPPIEEWDAIMVSRWGYLTREVGRQIDYFRNEEIVKDSIISNRWNEDGAEQYNFMDTKARETKCLVDIKKEQGD